MNAEYMASTICDSSALCDWLMQTPSPIVNEVPFHFEGGGVEHVLLILGVHTFFSYVEQEQPHVSANGPQLNVASNLILPENFDGNLVVSCSPFFTNLVCSTTYDYIFFMYR